MNSDKQFIEGTVYEISDHLFGEQKQFTKILCNYTEEKQFTKNNV